MAILDSPPPSPQLEQAGGVPSMQGLLSDPNAMMPGPDMDGIIKLGQTIDESLLLLAQMLPQGSESIGQARELIMMVLGQASQDMPMGPPPRDVEGLATTGQQFPGAPITSRGGV